MTPCGKIFYLPRFRESGVLHGWRACDAIAPGCVVILQDRDKACAMVACAVEALIQENINGIDDKTN